MAVQNKNSKTQEELKPADVQRMILGIVSDHGELDTQEIVAKVQAEADIDEKNISRAITGLDRKGLLTRQNQGSGWQVTSRGTDAFQELVRKGVAAYIAPYGEYTPIAMTYRFLAASLGPVTETGGDGRAKFPRLPDGEIVFYGGWFRAAFRKALDAMEATRVDPITGMPKSVPNAAWGHVTFSALLLPADTPTITRIRRPVNKKGEAIGEIIHEALPIGTVITISAEFPLTHFPEPVLRRLCRRAGEVGFSPAGSGRGGLWGVAELLNLKIGAEAEEVPA